MTWTPRLLDQLVFHWDLHLRPRLDGLSDEEYFWEPVPGAWNVRRTADVDSAYARAATTEYFCDWEFPEPVPPPVTTIAWRLAHVTVGVFGSRNASHFGGLPIDYMTYDYPGNAAGALANLDDAYALWVKGVSSLGADALERPVGPAEGQWARASYAELVLHINREVIHHGAEILLLRDLYRNR